MWPFLSPATNHFHPHEPVRNVTEPRLTCRIQRAGGKLGLYLWDFDKLQLLHYFKELNLLYLPGQSASYHAIALFVSVAKKGRLLLPF